MRPAPAAGAVPSAPTPPGQALRHPEGTRPANNVGVLQSSLVMPRLQSSEHRAIECNLLFATQVSLLLQVACVFRPCE